MKNVTLLINKYRELMEGKGYGKLYEKQAI